MMQQNNQVLKELAPYKNLVVSTGGGAVTQPGNWAHMHNGVVAWLEGAPDLLARRVVAEGVEKRPLLYGEGVTGEEERERERRGAALLRSRFAARCLPLSRPDLCFAL